MIGLINPVYTPLPEHDTTKCSRHLYSIDTVFFFSAAVRVGLRIIDVAINDTNESWFCELWRHWLTRCLSAAMRGENSCYSGINIYSLRIKSALTAY